MKNKLRPHGNVLDTSFFLVFIPKTLICSFFHVFVTKNTRSMTITIKKTGKDGEKGAITIYPLDFVLQVLMPNGAYSGQKEMRLVRTKIPARISNTNPSVPLMVLVKYKAAITTAITMRTILSVLPILAFMIIKFLFDVNNVQN